MPNIQNSVLNSKNFETYGSDYKPIKTEYDTDGFKESKTEFKSTEELGITFMTSIRNSTANKSRCNFKIDNFHKTFNN